jgi:transcriptional regulator with XRE-family HTH domain
MTKLKSLREELNPKVAQEDLARAGNIRISTYRNAERGRNVSYTTAKAILDAINSIRESRGMRPVDMDDLELTIV